VTPPGIPVALSPMLYDVQVGHCAFANWTPQPGTQLSTAESARAQRFVFERDQQAYTSAHQFVHETLAFHAHASASSLEFAYTAEQKPVLAPAYGLYFNLSHSKHHAVVATSHTYDVGVDIEELHTLSDALSLAQAHFTPAELDELHKFPAGMLRDRAFLQGWTRKEACLKAVGSGLVLPARLVHAGLAPQHQHVQLTWGMHQYRLEVQSFVHHELIGAVAVVNKP
jgi:4'-phosphopantetheinyl transferase